MDKVARCSILEKNQLYKLEKTLKEGYSGGEELRRAMNALAGPRAIKDTKEDHSRETTKIKNMPLPGRLRETKDPHIRELILAAQGYETAGMLDPGDFEAVYNHGLALQELALRCTETRENQEIMFRQAAERYEAAWKLCPKSHAALYNWGVALSDMARVVKPVDKDAAHQLLRLSAEKYSSSLQWNPHNPQALNNWALVLQEVATLQSPAEQASLVRHSIFRFRQAIHLRPDFDRACYNLGSVFYAFACSQQSSLTQRLPSRVTQDPDHALSEKEGEAMAQQLFGLAAQYILLAHVLQPKKQVYQKSLNVVRPLLPLPYLRSGTLTALSLKTATSERWQSFQFVLDAASFRQEHNSQNDDNSGILGADSDIVGEREAPGNQATHLQGAAESQQVSRSQGVTPIKGPVSLDGADVAYEIALQDIATVKRCSDPSLPRGHAFWLGLSSQPEGLYLVADGKDDADGWVDALLMCGHLASVNQIRDLEQALRKPDLDSEL